MRFRVEGTEQEIEQALSLLGLVFDLQEVSAPYANRGRSVFSRVYVTAVPRDVFHADAERTDNAAPNRPPFGELGFGGQGEITR